MIQNVLRRIRQDGLPTSLQFYAKAYAWRMSPNYRQNSTRFSAYHWSTFVFFVLYDYARVLADRCIGLVEHILVGRNEIPRDSLDEYVIRLVRSNLLNPTSIVYAFGVSRHIETEEEWASKLGCTVHLFDPTEPAIEFMRARAPDPKLIFDPTGVWTTSGLRKFYKDKRQWLKNLSVVNLYHSTEYVEAPCLTLSDIMAKYGHDHIDLLKMDIEGSALPILLHMLERTNIRPRQIVGSLERPHLTYEATLSEIYKVVKQKGRLFDLFSKEGYKIITHHSAEFSAIRA